MSPKDRAYVFVIAWPEDRADDGVIVALAEALGLDAFAAGEVVRRPLPTFACRVVPTDAPRAVEALKRRGVRAFALTHADLAARLEPPRLWRLCPATGSPEAMYLAHLDPRGSAGFKAADLRLLVRGRSRVVRGALRHDAPADIFSARVDPILGPDVPSRVVRGASASFTELLDLHLRDGSAYRLDASRFSFLDLLGVLGPSDIENTDRAAVVLAEQAPHALVDTTFASSHAAAALAPDFMSVAAARGGSDRRGRLAFGLHSAVLGLADRVERGVRKPFEG